MVAGYVTAVYSVFFLLGYPAGNCYFPHELAGWITNTRVGCILGWIAEMSDNTKLQAVIRRTAELHM